MRSSENLKLPPIFGGKAIGKYPYVGVGCQETDRSSETESDSSARQRSSRKFKSFKQVINIVGKNSKWTKAANEEVQGDKSTQIAPEEKRLTFNVNGKWPHVCETNNLLCML